MTTRPTALPTSRTREVILLRHEVSREPLTGDLFGDGSPVSVITAIVATSPAQAQDHAYRVEVSIRDALGRTRERLSASRTLLTSAVLDKKICASLAQRLSARVTQPLRRQVLAAYAEAVADTNVLRRIRR